jgi:hypothetical protein
MGTFGVSSTVITRRGANSYPVTDRTGRYCIKTVSKTGTGTCRIPGDASTIFLVNVVLHQREEHMNRLKTGTDGEVLVR